MPRSEVATALSITTPRSGVPGSVSVTATVLKLEAVLKIWFGFVALGHVGGLRGAHADRQQDGQHRERGQGPGGSVGENGAEHGGKRAHTRVTTAIGRLRVVREAVDAYMNEAREEGLGGGQSP